MQSVEHTWKIVNIVPETHSASSLYLKHTSERPSFLAGQYLTARIAGQAPVEGKAYSISSAPSEELIRITVKKMGSFSSAILNLKTGDTITTPSPFGFFYPDLKDNKDLFFIAGGIGVTPCMSIIRECANKDDSRLIHLFYSNKTKSDIAFRKELADLSKKNPNFHIHHQITREEPTDQELQAGRITPSQIIKHVANPEQTEFFISGSMDFAKTIWKGLHAKGVPQHRLYTEGFF